MFRIRTGESARSGICAARGARGAGRGGEGVLQAGPDQRREPRAVPDPEERRRRSEQDKAERAKTEDSKMAALRKENCNRARDQLRTMDSGQRVARIKPDGEREILDDQQRDAEANRARQAIAVDCR